MQPAGCTEVQAQPARIVTGVDVAFVKMAGAGVPCLRLLRTQTVGGACLSIDHIVLYICTVTG